MKPTSILALTFNAILLANVILLYIRDREQGKINEGIIATQEMMRERIINLEIVATREVLRDRIIKPGVPGE